MGKFLIFSHVNERGTTSGMRRSEVDGTEVDALRAARMREVLGDEQIFDIVQTDCRQESGKRMRQVERQGRKQ